MIRLLMTLILQIEEQKRKSHLIGDFVIEATHLEKLASQVFQAEAKVQTPAFQETCDTLRQLCESVGFSVRDLQGMIPVVTPSVTVPGEPEIMPPTD